MINCYSRNGIRLEPSTPNNPRIYRCGLFQGSLSSSAVGSIVELQSEEISQIASEYAERVSPVIFVEFVFFH